MNIFIIWLIILFLALATYLFFNYRASKRGFRFQVKLTIIFILLVLIPAVPLTMFVSSLLTKSMEMFLLPGMDNTLTKSLETIKNQIEREGILLLDEFDQAQSAHDFFQRMDHVKYIAVFEKTGNEIRPLQLHRGKYFSDSILFNHKGSIANSFLNGEITSRIRSETGPICEVFEPIAKNRFRLICFEIDPHLISVKEDITEAIRVYNSLSLFKNSVMEEQLIWAFATIFIILLTLIAIYAAKKLSKEISEPILELANGMKKMAAGELKEPIAVKAKDEIKFLVDSFNRMAQELKTSQEKLLRAERMAAWQELARRVSHEIRNSLTPIRLSLRRLWDKLSPAPDSDHPLNSISEEVDSLMRLAEEFSQFARMPQINPQKANLHEIIKSVVTLVQAEPGVPKIRLDFDESIPHLMLDQTQFRRAIYNLLKNSVEASQPATPNNDITIKTQTMRSGDKKVKIEIIDKGGGIDPKTLQKIFEPNFTTKKRGMGLGLSIVKRIIEDHNGTIQFHSASGKGTTVTILF